MRSMPLLVSLALAACGDDSNSGTDANDPRPDSGDDIDFDGVPNDMDNCPDASNGFQGNEDGDKFGDACDPCPPIAGDALPDGDADGVADACDPKPILFGDRVAFFEGFHQGKPSGWDEIGTWGGNGDALTGNVTGAGQFALIVTDRTRETITAEITVTSATGASSEVGLLDNLIQNGTSAVACAITGAPAVSVYETTNAAGAVTSAYQLTAGQTYQLTLTRENSTYTCTAKNVASSVMASATKNITLNNTPYLSGLTLNGANIRVKWFMVVESL